MKTITKTELMLKAIDIELKTLLKKDLQMFKIIRENKRVPVANAA